jgi:hypothetical protein
MAFYGANPVFEMRKFAASETKYLRIRTAG